MNLFYIVSIFCLLLSFLLFEKKKTPVSIVSYVVYSLCLFFCYQTVMVCMLSFIGLGGSLLNYSIFTFIISFFLFFASYKRKRIQKYYFHWLEIVLLVIVLISCVLVVLYRFRGFHVIAYASDDPAIHYRAALAFSNVLEKLTITNYHDIIFNHFNTMLPISYINGGMFIHLFSGFSSSYILFIIYDSLCFILYSLLFLITLFQLKKKNYFYFYIITMLYSLGFPLNNLIYGFCYLGLGVMVIHLVLYTFLLFRDDFKYCHVFWIVLFFILSFSMFFSYYLFVPFLYFSMFSYYFLQYKKKNISLKNFFMFVVISLVIPFIIGSVTLFISHFNGVSHVMRAVKYEGDIYHNVTPILFFFLVSYILFYYQTSYKKKLNYFFLSFDVLSIYIFIFFLLYMFHVVGFYYFYKLFYVYFLYALLFLFQLLYKKRKFLYGFVILIIIGGLYISFFPHSSMSGNLAKVNVYYYNVWNFQDDMIRFQRGDLEIVDKAIQYKNICEYNQEFITIGYTSKNTWFYSIVGSVPIIHHVAGDKNQLYIPSVFFSHWEAMNDYPCVIYFNEVKKLDYDNNKYDTLFENDRGVILKRRIEQ